MKTFIKKKLNKTCDDICDKSSLCNCDKIQSVSNKFTLIDKQLIDKQLIDKQLIDKQLIDSSKQKCMNLISESINLYLQKNDVNFTNQDEHYNKWLFTFSKEDYQNEFKNFDSGTFNNELYHKIWDSFFTVNDFVIV